MSDPFAFLNPIESTKTPAEKVLAQSTAHPIPPVTIAPISMGPPGQHNGMGMGMGMNMGMNMGMGMGAPPAANLYGMNQGLNQGMGMNMGMGMGMNMGMNGGMPHAPFAQQHQQQPVMYDNIKNLLQQKPKPPAGAFGDDASMDFLEHLSSGGAPAAHAPSVAPPAPSAPSPVATDMFGAPMAVVAPPASGGLDFGYLDPSAGSSAQTSAPTTTVSTAGKSSALADRLAHGKRKTQEAARSQLGFNAGAFSSSANTSRISLKDVGGASSSTTQRTGSSGAMSVDDFTTGAPTATTTTSNLFDDPFQSDSIPAPRTASGSGSNSRTDSKTPPMATVDNSFW
jgi:hypothetical protein